ncbi:MAG TPA: SGNH/GDSL hydrolase family protein [Leifsonia sp.]|jgi:lysophospholipase L1-like esterase|nr:SGNH/GDSL hydrolase family protein [Leifsonia sp.]
MRRRTLVIPIVAIAAVVALAGIGAIALTANTDAPAPPVATVTSTPTPTPTVDPFPRWPLTAETRYVALGDSFAAGMGAGGEKGSCLTSDKAYPDLFTSASGINLVANAACSGATTSDLLKQQLLPLDDNTDLVTISVGANDLGVAAVAADCAAGKAIPCRNELSSAISLLNLLPERLDQVYTAVAKSAPNARIVVTGYANLYDVSDPSAKNFTIGAAINAATIGLNEVIKEAVDKQRKSRVPITYLEVEFGGHGIGTAKPWVNTKGYFAFHPTATGYQEYSRELIRLLGTARG